ncbi:MAG: DUF1440 domain-containing protein [Pyrinomonadaceae bacterium]
MDAYKNQSEQHEGNVVKGLVAGIIGGLVASAVMNQYQKLISTKILGEERSHGAQSLQSGAPRHGAGRMLEEQGKEHPKDDAAERLANTIAVGVFDHELTEREKDIAGTLFHYAYGTSMGAVYGAAAEILPETTMGRGVPYGALIWLGADEGIVPVLGLSKSSAEYPLSIHASALASHLVFGLTVEIVRKAVRKVL